MSRTLGEFERWSTGEGASRTANGMAPAGWRTCLNMLGADPLRGLVTERTEFRENASDELTNWDSLPGARSLITTLGNNPIAWPQGRA